MLYPILLDVSSCLIVVIGGGSVAARKVSGVLAAGAARVRVVAPDFCPAMPDGVERIVETFKPHHLHGAGLVFAATDSSVVNDAVVEGARQLGILVNRADSDDEHAGDFTVPAIHRDGAVTLAVSAAGSPAIAARLRDQLTGAIDSRFVALANAMVELRPYVLSLNLPATRRRDLFRALAGEEAAAIMQRGGIEALRKWIGSR